MLVRALLPLLLVATASAGPAPASPTLPTRDLPADATFADLVARVMAVASTPAEAPCLVKPGDAGVHLAGRFEVPAVAQPPADDWNERLAKGLSVKLRSATMELGDTYAPMVLAALTPTPRTLERGMVPVLFVTDDGVWFAVVHPAFGITGTAEKLVEKDLAYVKAQILGKARGIVVTAEASVPVAQVVETLQLLDGLDGAVVLATASSFAPLETRPRAEVPPLPEAQLPPRCDARTLGAVPKGGGSSGRFPSEALDALPGALAAHIEATCAAHLPPDGGGFLTVGLKLDTMGKLTHACVQEDGLDADPAVACAVKATKAYDFPTPSGWLNTQIELALEGPGARQAALCPR